jgi:hypothetical protein
VIIFELNSNGPRSSSPGSNSSADDAAGNHWAAVSRRRT